jgi:hypothetical protein
MNEQDYINNLFIRISKSKFRSSFHLTKKDKDYILDKGLDKIKSHAYDFVNKRLRPSYIPNDGKQTPYKGHPVFVAQHATGCCCRGCLYKWHNIPIGIELNNQQVDFIVNILMNFIKKELNSHD